MVRCVKKELGLVVRVCVCVCRTVYTATPLRRAGSQHGMLCVLIVVVEWICVVVALVLGARVHGHGTLGVEVGGGGVADRVRY